MKLKIITLASVIFTGCSTPLITASTKNKDEIKIYSEIIENHSEQAINDIGKCISNNNPANIKNIDGINNHMKIKECLYKLGYRLMR